jgi:hypothetical protein
MKRVRFKDVVGLQTTTRLIKGHNASIGRHFLYTDPLIDGQGFEGISEPADVLKPTDIRRQLPDVSIKASS